MIPNTYFSSLYVFHVCSIIIKFLLLLFFFLGVCIIEGGLGCGKTYLMQELLSQSRIPCKSSPGGLAEPHVYVRATAADRYGRHVPFHPFSQMYVDVATNGSNTKEIILQKLEANAVELVPYASLLNDIFENINIESTPLASILSKEDKQTTKRVLMLALYRTLAEEEEAIYIIDEAMFLDAQSWEFTLDIVTGGKNIMESKPPCKEVTLYFQRLGDMVGKSLPLILILSTRPLLYFLDVIMPVIPPSFESLREVPSCDYMKIGRLSEKEIDSVVLEVVPDVTFHHETKKTLYSAFQGNPLLCQSILAKLFSIQPSVFQMISGYNRRASFIKKDKSASEELAMERFDRPDRWLSSQGDTSSEMDTDEFDSDVVLKFSPSFKIEQIVMPATFYKEASFRLDRLPPIQQLVLKTVSIMCDIYDNVWEYVWLEDSYPVEKHRSRLPMECGQLEDKGIIRKSDNNSKLKDGEVKERKYILQNPFLYAECFTRLLQVQKDKLKSGVKVVKNHLKLLLLLFNHLKLLLLFSNLTRYYYYVL